MPSLIGLGLAVSMAIFARITGLDRDRAFYPVALIVIASYYILFAVVGGDRSDLRTETLIFLLFAAIAIAGFRFSLWLVVGGLAAHGLFDFFHHGVVAGRGVPSWWPAFCLAYDVAAAVCLTVLLAVCPTASRPVSPLP
ncbi:MAG: hypothetical protein LH485_05785 [Sphingomonas bacterium]|nr:hypothetical protein [Sphingomonas bacterium]